eukprot:c17273_g2_i1 orf=679-1893(-)
MPMLSIPDMFTPSHSPPHSSRLPNIVDTDFVCQCVATVSGHNSGISSVVSSGEHLYTACLSNEIRMWEQPDLAPCDQFRATSDDMCSIKAILIAGDRIIGAHQDHKIRVWRRDRKSTGASPAHKLVAILPSKKDCLLKSLSQKNYVQVRRHHKKLWIEHTDTISALAIGRIQGVLYSASWDKTVKVWSLSDFRCLESIHAHDDAVNALAVCGEGGFLYTGSCDGKVKVWRKGPDAKKHVKLATLDGAHEKDASVNALALSEDGELLFSGGSDGAVAVWGRRKGQAHISVLLFKLAACHRLPILCLCTTKQEGGLLLSGSADKTVRVWRISSHEGHLSWAGVLQGHLGPVKSICVAPKDEQLNLVGGGCLVYTGSADKSIKAWWVSRRHSAALLSKNGSATRLDD